MPAPRSPSETTGSAILDGGMTPEEWSAYLAARGVVVEADTIRRRANELGACHKVFRCTIITGEQFDRIITGEDECRSSSSAAAASGTQKAASSITGDPSPDTCDAALAHLQRQARGNGRKPSRKGRGVVTSLETKRRS